jgi:hypothetical protein
MEKNYQLNLTQTELSSLVDFVDTHYDNYLFDSVYSKIIKLFETTLSIKEEMVFTEEELKHISWAVRYLSDTYYDDEETFEEYKENNIAEIEDSILSKIRSKLKPDV